MTDIATVVIKRGGCLCFMVQYAPVIGLGPCPELMWRRTAGDTKAE